jgi:hypothetical protein
VQSQLLLAREDLRRRLALLDRLRESREHDDRSWLPRAWRAVDVNLHWRALRRELERPALPQQQYMRRHGPWLALAVAACLGYLWLDRWHVRTGSWTSIWHSVEGVVGMAGAVALGAAFGYWRTAYEWTKQRRSVEAAMRFTDALGDPRA